MRNGRQCPLSPRKAAAALVDRRVRFGPQADITRVIKTAGVEPVRMFQPRCPLNGKKVLGALISRSLLCFMSRTPCEYTKASSGLSESCPKIGDIPKSPLLSIGSAGAVGRHNNHSK